MSTRNGFPLRFLHDLSGARTIGAVMSPDVVMASSAQATAFATFGPFAARDLGPEVERVEGWSWS